MELQMPNKLAYLLLLSLPEQLQHEDILVPLEAENLICDSAILTHLYHDAPAAE